jgi:DNA-binding MarR family transcriptional regulator
MSRYGSRVTATGRLHGLTPEQHRSWSTFMQMQELLRSRIEQRLTVHSGLSNADYTVLAVLAAAPGRRMRLVDLGATLGWERSRLHHQLTRMCSRGLVERGPMPDAEDGRAIQAILTDHGLAAIRQASRHHARHVRELVIEVLDDDQLAQLGEVSATLLAALRAQEPRRG